MAETNFETSLKKLEDIVQGLESGDLGLEEALKRFEEGVKIVKALNQKLEESRRKVEILVQNGEGGTARRPFEEGGEGEGEEAAPRPKKKARGGDQNSLF